MLEEFNHCRTVWEQTPWVRVTSKEAPWTREKGLRWDDGRSCYPRETLLLSFPQFLSAEGKVTEVNGRHKEILSWGLGFPFSCATRLLGHLLGLHFVEVQRWVNWVALHMFPNNSTWRVLKRRQVSEALWSIRCTAAEGKELQRFSNSSPTMFIIPPWVPCYSLCW